MTLLFCRVRQRNVPRIITHVHRLFCWLNILFSDVPVAVAVSVVVSSLKISLASGTVAALPLPWIFYRGNLGEQQHVVLRCSWQQRLQVRYTRWMRLSVHCLKKQWSKYVYKVFVSGCSVCTCDDYGAWRMHVRAQRSRLQRDVAVQWAPATLGRRQQRLRVHHVTAAFGSPMWKEAVVPAYVTVVFGTPVLVTAALVYSVRKLSVKISGSFSPFVINNSSVETVKIQDESFFSVTYVAVFLCGQHDVVSVGWKYSHRPETRKKNRYFRGLTAEKYKNSKRP